MNRSDKDTTDIEMIREIQWMQHDTALWFNENISEEVHLPYANGQVDPVDISELRTGLERTRNMKSTGLDRINLSL